MTARWTTDEELAAARHRFTARIPGYVAPAAYALARRDGNRLVLGQVNGGAEHYSRLPAVVLALVSGYVDRTGTFSLSARVQDITHTLGPASRSGDPPVNEGDVERWAADVRTASPRRGCSRLVCQAA